MSGTHPIMFPPPVGAFTHRAHQRWWSMGDFLLWPNKIITTDLSKPSSTGEQKANTFWKITNDFPCFGWSVCLWYLPCWKSRWIVLSNQGIFEACLKFLAHGRGGTKSWIWKTQVNSTVTPKYKNREKRFFEFGVRLDPPHWPSKFENHHVRVKFQNCRRPIEWPIKTCTRRALSLWERF